MNSKYLQIKPLKDFIVKSENLYKLTNSYPESHISIWNKHIKIPKGYYLEENDESGEYTSTIINEFDLFNNINSNIEAICEKSLYSSISSLVLKDDVIHEISLIWKFYFHNIQLGFILLVFLFSFLNAFNSEADLNLFLATKYVSYIAFGLSLLVSLCIVHKKIFFNWYTVNSFTFLLATLYATISYSISYKDLLNDRKWLVVYPALLYGQQLMQTLHETFISYIDDMVTTILSMASILIFVTIFMMALFCALNPNFKLNASDPLALFTSMFTLLTSYSLSGLLTNNWYDYMTSFLFVNSKIIILYIILITISAIIRNKIDMFMKHDLSTVAVHRLYVMWPYISFLKPNIKNRNFIVLKSA